LQKYASHPTQKYAPIPFSHFEQLFGVAICATTKNTENNFLIKKNKNSAKSFIYVPFNSQW